jgi:hypothetical protein
VTLAAVTLAGCASQVPDSGRGVGYSDYAAYEIERAQREAALTGAATSGAPRPLVPAAGAGAPITSVGVQPVTQPIAPPSGITSADLSAAGIGPVATTPVAPAAPLPTAINTGVAAPLPATPPAQVQIASTGISDEQDFDAVADRVSIEADAERRRQQQAAYQVIQPTALPTRSGDTGPNLVQYAISAPNTVGQQRFSRSILSGEGRFQRNCAAYRTPDDAQRDFLTNGGPDRDPRGIDPDGDGFACGWDPVAFRAAVGLN